MKVLLDECVDWRLSRSIVGHDVKTARQMGWSAIKNGELLTLASLAFDVFVTVDRNLSFQQNLALCLRSPAFEKARMSPAKPNAKITSVTTILCDRRRPFPLQFRP